MEEMLENEKVSTVADTKDVVSIRSVGRLDSIIQENGSVLEAAQKLYESTGEDLFYLGGLLAKLYHEKVEGKHLFATYGYTDDTEGWNLFCFDKFGFKGRKGFYLKDIYIRYTSIPDFNFEKIKQIGWSKAALLASSVEEGNVDELVEEAKTTSIRELKEKLQASNVEAGLRNKQITFTFKLFADQAEIVRNAITQVQQDFGYENPNQAFEHIITEWAEEHLNVEAAANEGTEER